MVGSEDSVSDLAALTVAFRASRAGQNIKYGLWAPLESAQDTQSLPNLEAIASLPKRTHYHFDAALFSKGYTVPLAPKTYTQYTYEHGAIFPCQAK